MSEPRKASEVLLALEEKIDKLTKIVSVYDINVKLILDRVNKIYAYIESMPEDNGQPPTTQDAQSKEIVPISSEHVITEVESQIGQRRTARAETYQPISPQPLPELPTQQVPMAPPNSDKKIPIIQRVTLVDGGGTAKDLFMAEVSIFNDNKELVLKTKTNAAGKWQAHLRAGSYTVNIVKTDTATKKKIEAMQEIIVNDSNTTLTLPTAIVKR